MRKLVLILAFVLLTNNVWALPPIPPLPQQNSGQLPFYNNPYYNTVSRFPIGKAEMVDGYLIIYTKSDMRRYYCPLGNVRVLVEESLRGTYAQYTQWRIKPNLERGLVTYLAIFVVDEEWKTLWEKQLDRAIKINARKKELDSIPINVYPTIK